LSEDKSFIDLPIVFFTDENPVFENILFALNRGEMITDIGLSELE
jgi:hypothetical protein